jgi:hypothetical protein
MRKRGFSSTSQHLTEKGAFYGTFGASFAENGACGPGRLAARICSAHERRAFELSDMQDLGISRNTGSRWLNGRNGVPGLRQQGLDPRRRLPVPVASGSSRYLAEDERVFIADRLLARSSLRSFARELGRSRQRSAGSWLVTARTRDAITRFGLRRWPRAGAHVPVSPHWPATASCASSSWNVWPGGGVRSRFVKR